MCVCRAESWRVADFDKMSAQCENSLREYTYLYENEKNVKF